MVIDSGQLIGRTVGKTVKKRSTGVGAANYIYGTIYLVVLLSSELSV